MLHDLTWDNYLEINDKVRQPQYVFDFFSPVQLIQWTCYGFELKFHIVENALLFYCRNQTYASTWSLFQSYYTPDANINNLKTIVAEDLTTLNGTATLYVSNVSQKMIHDWQWEHLAWEELGYTSNYIYELGQLKTFAGNKMQKKRNHLNAFLKANHDVTIKDIHSVPVKDLLKACEQWNHEYNGDEDRQNEIHDYQELLQNQMTRDSRYSGIVVYIENQLVGFTLGFSNHDVYEIIIEKAVREIRGLFQYIIKTNLENNAITTPYIDREDDVGQPKLAKSKLSYNHSCD